MHSQLTYYTYVLNGGIQHIPEVAGVGTTRSPKTYCIFHGKRSGLHLNSEQPPWPSCLFKLVHWHRCRYMEYFIRLWNC